MKLIVKVNIMSNESLLRDDLTIPAGTTIKFSGVPFRLMSDTLVQGLESNLDYAKDYENTPKVGSNIPTNDQATPIPH